MEKLTGCFLSAVLLAVLSSALAGDTFFGDGDHVTLVLRPPFSGQITSILWKHNNNLVAEWVKDKVPLLYYGGFNNRTSLDTNTGRLEIQNMSQADIGEYSVDINNNVQPERFNAKLIKAVPKPTLVVRPLTCTAKSKECLLTCNGETGEAEPVTYSWKMGGAEWMDGEKDWIITNNETTQRVETFTCRMKNPISEKESKPEPNKFFKEVEENSSAVGVVVGVLVLISAVGVVVGILKRKDIQQWIASQKSSNPSDNNAAVNGQQGSPTDVEKNPLNAGGPAADINDERL